MSAKRGEQVNSNKKETTSAQSAQPSALKIDLIVAHKSLAPILTKLSNAELETLTQVIVEYLERIPTLVACRRAWARMEKANDATIASRYAHRIARNSTRQARVLTAAEKEERSLKGKIRRRQMKLEEVQKQLRRLEMKVSEREEELS